MFSHAHDAVFGDHLVLVTTARWRTHACCKITVSQPWSKYSCVAFFEAAGAKFCDNATAWTALLEISLTMPNKKYFFDFLLLKIFTDHNVENFSQKSPHQLHLVTSHAHS